jgi:hypothetical protein
MKREEQGLQTSVFKQSLIVTVVPAIHQTKKTIKIMIYTRTLSTTNLGLHKLYCVTACVRM